MVNKYDVSLSFSEEKNDYVCAVANELLILGLNVFYYKFELFKSWGKDLAPYLKGIYKDKSNLVVVFLDRHYENKIWTNFELESAQVRNDILNKEYVFFIIFDDIKPPSCNYLNGEKVSPKKAAKIINRKL